MVAIFISKAMLSFDLRWSEMLTAKGFIRDSCKYVVGLFVMHYLTVLDLWTVMIIVSSACHTE